MKRRSEVGTLAPAERNPATEISLCLSQKATMKTSVSLRRAKWPVAELVASRLLVAVHARRRQRVPILSQLAFGPRL